MLHLELSAFESLAGPHYQYKGIIGNIRGGRQADYFVALKDEEDRVVASAQLLGYPRWAEPLTGFVARCIAQALQAEPQLARPVVRLATLNILLNRTHLREVHAGLHDGVPHSSGYQLDVTAVDTPPTLWQLVQWSLAFDAWGTVQMPPVPAPLAPPGYYHDGVTYCRTSDLPIEARVKIEGWLWGQTMPVIPGVQDACYQSDMERFLGP
jgi:hypothetical protein